MELYPTYFNAIKNGEKTFEGRAYKADSDKEYHNLRKGDQIVFSINQEAVEWQEMCKKLGLRINERLLVGAGDVYHGSTVHEIFQSFLRLLIDFHINKIRMLIRSVM